MEHFTSLNCLIVGLGCAFVALVAYWRERREEATAWRFDKRRIVEADMRPQFRQQAELPWKRSSWS